MPAPLPALRVLKSYADDAVERAEPLVPRADLSLRFATEEASVTPADPLQGDCEEQPQGYCVSPIAIAELRGGAVTRDGFVFTERNELVRESVDRVSYLDRFRRRHPDLEAELEAAEPEPAPETVAMLSCQRNVNYFHWWIDVVARCWLLRNSPLRDCRLVTPPLDRRFQHESLRLLQQSTTPLPRPLQRFRRLVFARGLTYGSSQAIAPQISEFAQWCRTTMELPSSCGRRKLLLSRRGARRRRLMNEDRILAALGEEFEPVQLESLSVKEQATLFAEAASVVAPHGAGLTNLLFCPQPTPVLELIPDQPRPHTYRRLANLLGHPYIALNCATAGPAQTKPGERGLVASPSDVTSALARLEDRVAR